VHSITVVVSHWKQLPLRHLLNYLHPVSSMGSVTKKEIRAVEMEIQHCMKGYQNIVAEYSKVSPHTYTIPQLISLFSILENPTTIAQVSHGIHALKHVDILSYEKCTYLSRKHQYCKSILCSKTKAFQRSFQGTGRRPFREPLRWFE